MKNFYKKAWQWRQYMQKAGIALFASLAAMQSLDAQVNIYTFAQSSGAFSSIASSGTLVTGSDATTTTTNDGAGWSVAIPFNFNFNNTDFTSIYVNSNGGATFGTTTSTSSTVISTSTAYSGAVAVMNRDLWGVFVTSGVTTAGSNIVTNVASFKGLEVGKELGNNTTNGIPVGTTVTAFDETAGTITMSAPATASSATALIRYGTGKVLTKTEGVAPNRVFVIEWLGYNDYSAAATGSNYLNFQLRLAESTNTVSIVYGPYFNINTASRTNQIGLRGASNTDYNNRLGAAGNPWDNTTAGTSNSSTVARDNTNFPASGLTFTWSPPTCLAPTALTVDAASITPVGTTVSWTAPSAAPNGYEVYYSTSNTAPTASTVLDATNSVTSATASASISNLSPSTNYYVWVRSACVGTDRSVWIAAPVTFRTLCQPPALLSTTGDSFCPGSTAVLSATAESGAVMSWYDVATGGAALATGSSFTTPVLATTTTYYVSAKSNSSDVVGPVNPSTLTGISSSNYDIDTYYQIFDVTAPVTLTSIDVFPASSVAIGTNAAIEIRDNSGATLISVPYTVAVNGGSTPQTVTINYALPVGTGYRIGQGDGLSISLNRNTSGATYPFTSNGINVTGNNFSSGANYWYYIYNWQFSFACESARQAVVATADTAECLGVSEAVTDKNNIKAYPNPFSDILNISDVANVKSISVIDVAGRVVKSFDKPESTLHLRELKSGMYLLVLNMKDGSKQTIKAIKK